MSRNRRCREVGHRSKVKLALFAAALAAALSDSHLLFFSTGAGRRRSCSSIHLTIRDVETAACKHVAFLLSKPVGGVCGAAL